MTAVALIRLDQTRNYDNCPSEDDTIWKNNFPYSSQKRISSLLASFSSFMSFPRGVPTDWRALTRSPVRGGAGFVSTVLEPGVLNYLFQGRSVRGMLG